MIIVSLVLPKTIVLLVSAIPPGPIATKLLICAFIVALVPFTRLFVPVPAVVVV